MKNKTAKIKLEHVVLGILVILLLCWWMSKPTALTLEEMREPADITQPDKGTGIDIHFYDRAGNEIPIPSWFKINIVQEPFTIVTRPETAPACTAVSQCPGYDTNEYIVCHEGFCGLKSIAEMSANIKVENPISSTEKYLNINLDTVTSDGIDTWYNHLVSPTTTFALNPGENNNWACNPIDVSGWEGQTITFFVKIEGTSELTQKISRPTASLTLKFSAESDVGDLIVTIEPTIEPPVEPEPEIPTDYVSCWKFEDNANDERGINNGIEQGNPTYVQGKVGKAVNLDGDDYIRIVDDDSLDFGLSDFSLCLWVKIYNSDGYAGLINKENGDPRYYINVLPDNNVRVLVDDGPNRALADGTTNIDDDTWHHICSVFDRSEINGAIIYLDGDDDTASRMGDLTNVGNINNGHDLLIGKRGGQGYYVRGMIDEVIIYDRALSISEVQLIHNLQK